MLQSMKPHQLESSAEFQLFVQKEPLCLFVFTSSNCTPCINLKQALSLLNLEEVCGRLFEIDIHENIREWEDVFTEYEISGVPSILLTYDGNLVDGWAGFYSGGTPDQNAEKLSANLRAAISELPLA